MKEELQGLFLKAKQMEAEQKEKLDRYMNKTNQP